MALKFKNESIKLPSPKRATIYEVAKLAGVSHNTAARTFSARNMVADKTRKKVLIAARALDYQPNYFARALRGGKTNSISILWSFGQSYSPQKVFFDFINKGQKRGYQVSFSETWGDPNQILATLKENTIRGVESVILLAPIISQLDHLKEALFNLKSVLLVANEPWPIEVDQVVWDRTFAIKEVVGHFAKTGRKRPLFITDASSNTLKVTSFLSQLEKRYNSGEASNRAIMDIADLLNGNVRVFLDFLENNFDRINRHDAFLCSCDTFAAVLMRFLTKRGVRVPEDVAIVGYNNEPIAEIVNPELASVDRCKEELSSIIERMVFARLDNPKLPIQRESLKMKFVWRPSAG